MARASWMMLPIHKISIRRACIGECLAIPSRRDPSASIALSDDSATLILAALCLGTRRSQQYEYHGEWAQHLTIVRHSHLLFSIHALSVESVEPRSSREERSLALAILILICD